MTGSALGLAVGLCTAAVQAAPMQNLGFDEANTNHLVVSSEAPVRGIGSSEDLLPGWQLSKGGTPQTTLGLNLSLLTSGYATLVSADQSDYFRLPVEGKYGLYLVGTAANQEPFALSQRGEIPASATFLSLTYSGYGFLLTLDGKPQPPASQTSTLETFNIAPFSGRTVDLTLTALGPLMPTQAGSAYIDNIVFTVAEPSTLALISSGAVLTALAACGKRPSVAGRSR